MTSYPFKHHVRASPGAQPAPALLLLHGYGADERDLVTLADYLDPRLTVLIPRAPYDLPWGGYSWLSPDDFAPTLSSLSIADVMQMPSAQRVLADLQEYLRQAQKEFRLDPDRTLVGGFSLGAALAGTLMLLEPERFAGAILASGFLPAGGNDHYRDLAGKPVFQGHGEFDQVVPIRFARQAADLLRAAGAGLTYRTYPIAHAVSPAELADIAAWLDLLLNPAG